MYTVASYLVEQRSGLSFSEYLHRHFFHPLEMTSTSLQPKEARAKGLGDRICQGHLWEDDEQEYMAFDFPDTPEGQGAGSIITSVNDYIKYVKAVMDKRAPFNEQVYKGIMKERTIMGLETEKPYLFSSPRIYAAGWRLHYYRGYQVVAHQGEIPGCSTTHLFLPDLKFGCVIFANAGGADSVISILVHELIDEVLKVPQDQRLDWEQVEKTMSYEEEITGPATVAHGESLPSSNPGQPRPQERPLSSYRGEYRHPGYGSIEVRVKEGQLFVDANDRSLAVEMNFEFLPEETKFVAYLSCRTEGICDRVPAGLRFDDNGCSWLGMELDEPKILVWFERVRGEDSRQQSRT
jgi:CubicO group peptidase (beta-lactamase class C family)